MTGQSRFNVRADSCQGKPSLATPMNPVQPDPPGSKNIPKQPRPLILETPPGLRRFPILRRMPGGMRPQTFWHLPHFALQLSLLSNAQGPGMMNALCVCPLVRLAQVAMLFLGGGWFDSWCLNQGLVHSRVDGEGVIAEPEVNWAEEAFSKIA